MDEWMDEAQDIQFGLWASMSRIQAEDEGRSDRQEGAAFNEYFLGASPSFMQFNIYWIPAVRRALCKVFIQALFI